MATAGSSAGRARGGDHEILHAIDHLFPGTAAPRRAGRRGAPVHRASCASDERAARARSTPACARHGLPRTPARPRPERRAVRAGGRRTRPPRGPDRYTILEHLDLDERGGAAPCRRVRSRPSIAELRAATQPASIFARNSGEHWAGRLYVRRALAVPDAAADPHAADARTRVTWLMIVVGVAAAGAAGARPALWPALGAVVLIQLQILLDCSDGELARWREQSPRRSASTSTGSATTSTETALPIALGIRADEAGRSALDRRACSAARRADGDARSSPSRALEAGLPAGRGHAPRSPRRGAPLLAPAAPRRSASSPFFRAFVAIEFTLPGAGRRDRRRCAGELRHARARRRAGRRSRRSPPPGTCRDRHLRAAAMTRSAASCSRRAAGRTTCARRSARCSRQRGRRDSTSWSSATAGSPRGCPTGVRGVHCPRTTRHPRRAATPASRTSRGELLFFLDDDARARRPTTRSRAWQRSFAAEPDARAGAAARRPPRRRAPPPRDWVPRLRVGDRGALERRHGRVGGRGRDAARRLRAGRRLAGGVPLRPRGRRPRAGGSWTPATACATRATSRRCTPSPAAAAARLLRLLRRPQPGVARPPPPARCRSASSTCSAFVAAHAPALRALARAVAPRRCAATATACAARAARAARCGPDTLWRMTRAGRPPIM